jgi:hypothetical protein
MVIKIENDGKISYDMSNEYTPEQRFDDDLRYFSERGFNLLGLSLSVGNPVEAKKKLKEICQKIIESIDKLSV